jgi:glucokinase
MMTATAACSTPARPLTLRMGVDVGGTSIKWVVLDGESVIRQGRRPTPGDDETAVLRAIADLAATERVESVGVALPAVIDAEAGATLVAPNLPGEWHGLAIVEPLQDELGVPVTVCNDGRALTNAEWVLGAARGCRDAVVLALGTGVGGGIVSDGRIIRGPRGRAGELGHIPVEPTGERCGCGAVGCLETVAGARALVRAGRLSPELIVEAASQGDAAAREVLARAGAAIGRAFATLAVSLNPELFVVGGGLAPALALMRPAIEAQLQDRTSLTGTIPIVPSALGLHAGAIGAALWKEDQ